MTMIETGFYRKYSDDGDYVAVVQDDLTVQLYLERQDGSFHRITTGEMTFEDDAFIAAARAEAIAQVQASCHHDWQLFTSGSIRIVCGEVADDRDEWLACSRCGKREDV